MTPLNVSAAAKHRVIVSGQVMSPAMATAPSSLASD
jgi:hypothetical protein